MTALTQAQRIAALDLIVPADDPLFVLDQARSMFAADENLSLQTGLLTIAGQIISLGAGVGIEAFFGGPVTLTETHVGIYSGEAEPVEGDEYAVEGEDGYGIPGF